MKVCVIGLAIACLVASGQSITDQDIAYGWNTHKQIEAQYQFINERAQAETVARVFDRLCQTRIGRSSPVAPSVFYIHDPEIQAFATGGGRVYITDGFVNGTGADERVMAFALSHEMAHNLRQHGIESALRRMAFEEQVAYFKRRIALGDNKAGWELLAYVAAERTISAKLDRDQESEADHLGMLMSADAGFHPDFMILSARLLRGLVGEQSKFGAFFSGHPRWETREQRIRQDFGDALAAFRSRWPDAHDSPGGAPPPIVETGVAIAVRDKGTSTLSVPIWSRNIDTPVQVFVDAGGIRTVRDFAFDENMYMRLSLSGEQLKALEKAKTGVRVTAVQGTKTLLDQTVPFEVQQSRRKK